MLDKSKAIKIEIKMRQNAGVRKTYYFKCATNDCNNIIRARCDALRTHSGKCSTHSHVKKPFESLYNGIYTLDRKDIKVELTYEEFLNFTKIKSCHYCFSKINWVPYSTIKGKYTSRAYYLDRKENKENYTTNNCVVCCTRCNSGKSNKFSYKEWFGMTKYFRDLKEALEQEGRVYEETERECIGGVCGL